MAGGFGQSDYAGKMTELKLKFVPVTDEVKDWLSTTRNNDLDPAIFSYPTLRVLCAYDGEPEAYLPIQMCVVLESLALKPGIDAHQYMEAIRTLVKGATLCASDAKVREIYFIATDEGVLNVALNHGFEKIESPVLRMRL
jgi:hypothetical protein